MEDVFKTAGVVWDYVTAMPGHLLLVLLLNIVGLVLKRIRHVPNNLIPALLVLGGAVLYPFIGQPGQVSTQLRNPQMVLVIYGVLLGFAAWILHLTVLKRGGKFIRRLPLVGDALGDALDLEPLAERKDDMTKVVLLAALAVVLTGCTTVQTTQTETDLEGYTRTTTFKARSFFDSKNELARAHTTMTDKTQGVTVAGLTTEASGSNAVSLTEMVVGAAVSAAIKAAAPVP